MTIRTSPWPPGTPCWADLTVPDVEQAQAFYGAVLGWEFSEAGEEYRGYVSALRRQAPAAGIGPQREPGPIAWTLYLASGDVEATARAVTAHGGRLVVPAGEVGQLGRMAMAADPAGAVFGVWEAGSHIGASLVNEPGGLAWEDLRSTDPLTARDFYVSVFGYQVNALEMAGPEYWTFHHPGEQAPLGGMGGMMGETGGSRWVVYFSVQTTDEAVASAQRTGGSVIRPPFDTPFGRMAELADPFGASFMVAQNTGQEQPDRSG